MSREDISDTNEKRLNEKRDEFIFDLIKRRFDGEIERADSLDSKAGNMVGFVSIVIGLILGSASVLSGGELFGDLSLLSNQYATFLYFAGIAVLLISIGCALVAIKVRKWVVVPDVKSLIEKYAESKYTEVLHRVGGTMSESISNSEKQNKNKAVFIEFSWYSLLLGLVLIFASYIVLASGFGIAS